MTSGHGQLTTRLVPSGKQRPLDVVQVVCPLVPVHDMQRLTDPDSFFDFSESLIIFSVQVPSTKILGTVGYFTLMNLFSEFILLCFQAVLPAMYFIPGSDVNNNYENSLDALYQIANSPRLLVFCLLYLTSIAFYNYFGLAVTRSLTGKLLALAMLNKLRCHAHF